MNRILIAVMFAALLALSCQDFGAEPSQQYKDDLLRELIFRDLLERVPPQPIGNFRGYVFSVYDAHGHNVDPSTDLMWRFVSHIPTIKPVGSSYRDSAGIRRDTLTEAPVIMIQCSYVARMDADHATSMGAIDDGYSPRDPVYYYTLTRESEHWHIASVDFVGWASLVSVSRLTSG